MKKLYEDLLNRTEVFDNNKLKRDFEKVNESGLGLNIFIRLLKQNRESFLTWYKDNIEKYESGIPKAALLKNETLLNCDHYIKEGLFIKFINEDLTLYNVDKENKND